MRRATAVTAALLAFTFAVGCGTTRVSKKKDGKADVNVQLKMINGQCAVDPAVDLLGGSNGNKISWTVKNVDCATAQYVAFVEYREYQNGGFGQPEHVVDPDPAYSKQLSTGDSDKVNAKIDKSNWEFWHDKVFKYKICIDTNPNPQPTGNCLDPDVDVWPGF